jgi:flagellar hook-associated protein 1
MSDIYGIGLSGLLSAQLGLATTSNNISNSSTPGYTVENPVFTESSGQYTGSGFIGGGVTTATVQRNYAQYLTSQLNSAQSTNSSLTANLSLATELNNFVGSPTAGISAAITTYFTGLQNVANSPSSVAERQTAISDAQSLAAQINEAGQQFDQLRQGVNQQLTQSVSQINSYSQQIASLNTQIAEASSQGQPPNQLLDQRDQAVSQLSQLVGASVVQNSQGYSVFLPSGQPLVVANQSFDLGTSTSAGDPSELAVTYNGLAGTTPTGPTDYLSASAITGGTVGGLLSFRSQTLDPAESQLGAIATSFANQLNQQNALGLTLSGTAGGPLFTVGAPQVYANQQNKGNATLTVGFANPAQPTSDDYSLSYDGTNYTLTDTTTGQTVGPPVPAIATTSPGTTIGGLTITMPTGAMNAGDSFTIQPTRGALDSFALATTNPSDIAAASPVLASAGSSNVGTATITQGTVTAGYNIPSTRTTLTYDSATGSLSGWPVGSTVSVNGGPSTTIAAGTTIAYTPGDTYTIDTTPATAGPNAVSVTITGSPANGDTFTIGQNLGMNDGRNALAMSNLISSTSLSGQTLTGAYANYVNNIGNAASGLQAASTAQTALVSQIQSSQQSVSGVNLDEEAANLLKYQQLYQASSKVITTAESMFQTLITSIQ